MDGILSILNAHYGEDRFSITSRVVYHIYDSIQAAYDGEMTDGGVPSGSRRTFFSAGEIVAMAETYLLARER